jgi:hypothetical protein
MQARSGSREYRIALILLALLMLGLLPAEARGQTPTQPDRSAPPIPSHDWRAPGFVAVVDGHLYDPECRPLRSVGSNVPNLMFRLGVRENLEWMRQHQMRWMRVIVTGHGQNPPYPDVATSGAIERRLGELLREVEAFNAAHDPRESIYVLASLTDYYETGVPGDRYGFDKPGWCLLRVLNAPWYRRGVPRYDFEQECNGGRLEGAPNYEANYKPWVQRVVAAVAGSRALLGWQLGNELKARNSDRNGIAEAYAWYLDWTRDMVDTIRSSDRAHLIFTGSQFLAELIDWPYRPNRTEIQADLRPQYDEAFDNMLRACGTYCWNVWSLTNFDFLPYPVDDAMLHVRAGVAAVVTEFGFTLTNPRDEQERFGGDRRLALRQGLARPWQDIFSAWHPRHWGTAELVEAAGLEGIAPWGSPDPDPATDPWPDVDAQRGISLAPEGPELWDIWRDVAAQLEDGNRRAGPSAACQALSSV